MSAKSRSSKANDARMLRVGVLLNRALIEEKQFAEPQEVTVGHSLTCTFSVPVEGMPKSFSMFTVKDGHYTLHFSQGMEGRISNGGAPQRLSDLQKLSAMQGDHWSLALSDSARGKIELGDMSVLFQLVAQPPPLPKVSLPATVRGSITDRMDGRLMAIVGLSLAVHVGTAVYAGFFADPPARRGLSAQAYQLTFKPEEVALIEPPVVEDKGEQGAQGDEEKKVETKKPAGGGDKKGPAKENGDTGGRDANSAATLQAEAASLASILTSGEEDPFGVGGGDAKRSPGSDLGAQLNQLGDSKVAIAVGGQSGRGTRDGGARVGTGTGPNLGGGQTGIASSGGENKTEQSPSGRISVSDKKALDETTLSPDAVLSKIKSVYMSALQRCYKDHLKADPSARGKVNLSFTVNEKGRAVSTKAKGFAADVDSCIEARMAGWTFPVPKDSDGEATDAGFSISLQFVPD